jgi:hypothetical protein
MNKLALSLTSLFLPFAVQAAVTIDEFATGRIYSTVNGDGISVFTDIEPDELRALPVGSSSSMAQNVLPQAKVVNVNVTASRRAANPGIVAQEIPPPPPADQSPVDLTPHVD